MNFQEKILEATADWRARATAIATAALNEAKVQATTANQRMNQLKGSIAVLGTAGRELNEVARRHGARFLKQNSTLATAASKDISQLARDTYTTLTRKPAPSKARRSPARKRARAKAA